MRGDGYGDEEEEDADFSLSLSGLSGGGGGGQPGEGGKREVGGREGEEGEERRSEESDSGRVVLRRRVRGDLGTALMVEWSSLAAMVKFAKSWDSSVGTVISMSNGVVELIDLSLSSCPFRANVGTSLLMLEDVSGAEPLLGVSPFEPFFLDDEEEEEEEVSSARYERRLEDKRGDTIELVAGDACGVRRPCICEEPFSASEVFLLISSELLGLLSFFESFLLFDFDEEEEDDVDVLCR